MTETTIENYQERAARTMPDLGSQGGNLGYLAWHSFKSENEAKQWVINLIKYY